MRPEPGPGPHPPSPGLLARFRFLRRFRRRLALCRHSGFPSRSVAAAPAGIGCQARDGRLRFDAAIPTFFRQPQRPPPVFFRGRFCGISGARFPPPCGKGCPEYSGFPSMRPLCHSVTSPPQGGRVDGLRHGAPIALPLSVALRHLSPTPWGRGRALCPVFPSSSSGLTRGSTAERRPWSMDPRVKPEDDDFCFWH